MPAAAREAGGRARVRFSSLLPWGPLQSRWGPQLESSQLPWSAENALYCARDRRGGLRVRDEAGETEQPRQWEPHPRPSPSQILAIDDASKPASFGGSYGRARALHLALGAAGHLVTVLPWCGCAPRRISSPS